MTPGWQNGQEGYKRVFTGSDIVCLAIQAILVNTLMLSFLTSEISPCDIALLVNTLMLSF